LRTLCISPNGHANTAKRLLMDKGLRYILECCRTLFNYAAKQRHLSPYAENPFRILDIDRIPLEEVRPITLFTAAQEQTFLEACDDWQFPLFITLLMTGLRPGELCHLVLPEDLDLDARVVRVRNKPRLGWQVKTRNQREVPLVPVLADVLRTSLGPRSSGPVFRRRHWTGPKDVAFDTANLSGLEQELRRRVAAREAEIGQSLARSEHLRLAKRLWRDLGAVEEDRVRVEFMRLTQAIAVPSCTAPKLFRHQFATALQEGRVDPLIRNLLMGHAPATERTAGHGLGMTAVYTHSRPETCRQQLEAALAGRPASAAAAAWLARQRRDGTAKI
jgi:integrase